MAEIVDLEKSLTAARETLENMRPFPKWVAARYRTEEEIDLYFERKGELQLLINETEKRIYKKCLRN